MLSFYGPELTHDTEKLEPSDAKPDGDAFVAPPLVTIVIWWTLEPQRPITWDAPPMVAVLAPSVPQEIVPKSAKGRMPPDELGASVIHSAELLWALFTLAEVLKDCPVVESVIVTVNVLPLKCTDATILSPGWTVRAPIRKDGCG